MAQLLGLWAPWWCHVCRNTGCLRCRGHGPISLLQPLAAGDQKVSGQAFSVAPPIQAHRGAPGWSPALQFGASVTQRRTRVGFCSVVQRLMGRLSTVRLPVLACGVRAVMVMVPPPTHDSAVLLCFHGCPAFLRRRVPRQSLPHIPSTRLSAVSSSPRPGIAPQSLNSSSPPLYRPGDLLSAWGKCGCSRDCLILIPFRLPQISSSILRLKYFSSNSDNCPDVGIGPQLQFPYLPRFFSSPLFFSLVLASY